uniref:Superoxide dismutase n=1 Tax=Angiostrongylus cantonensis TaxID=6313 RepID=A0A0K0D4L0_ANGCA
MLTGPQSVVGRALVIHARRDDLGLGNSPLSLTTGDSGGRVLCGYRKRNVLFVCASREEEERHIEGPSFCPMRRPVLRARANMRRAVANAGPAETIGSVDFEQNGNVVSINGSVSGLTPGLHGIHIHEIGDLGNGCLNARGHYNPTNNPHGAPSDRIRHVGDLGNLITPVRISYRRHT